MQDISKNTTKTLGEQFKIPKIIEDEVKIALYHYPELLHTNIEFKFTDKVGKSVMLAQPKFKTMLRTKRHRAYIILISKIIKIEDSVIKIANIPEDVLIGWIGHELGHIMDYRNRNTFNLIAFGVRYLISKSYIRTAERTADTYAVQHGMKPYILATKNFILNHSSLSEKYKQRIKRLYLSPEEVLEIVEHKN